MRIHLIASGSCRAAAAALQARIGAALGASDICEVRSSDCVAGDDPCGDEGSPDLAIVIVDADTPQASLESCRQLVGRLATGATDGVVLAAGDERVHAELESLLCAGAADLLYLPVGDAELRARVARALGRAVPARAAPETAARDPRLERLVGNSRAFSELLARIPQLAACDTGVLVIGETGTGKELVAQALHYLSARASRAWVAINCGAIPNDLVESELFGHARGAYTSAHAARPGLVEEAEGGTLFLDDVDCLPLAAQAKLLRLLQEREYRPVGSAKLRRADIRLVAASNRQLVREVARGSFRADLFYRLNVLTLALPALRDRRDDIPLLAMHFLRLHARRLHKPGLGLAMHAVRKLMRHDWPGNVRELQNTMERAVLLAQGGMLGAADIQFDRDDGLADEEVSFQDAKARVVERFERDYIEQMLARCNGNITLAARESGKHRRAFFELIRKHRIASDEFRAAD